MAVSMAELGKESELFASKIDEWRRLHMGKYVVIKGDEITGFFGSLEEAFRAGTERFGLDPFFVRQITPADSVNVSFLGRKIRSA